MRSAWRDLTPLEYSQLLATKAMTSRDTGGVWEQNLFVSNFPGAALMTSGGVTPQPWREVDYFPFQVLRKKWPYYLFTMLKQRVGTRAIKAKIDVLWRTYPRGLVAYWEEGKARRVAKGWRTTWRHTASAPRAPTTLAELRRAASAVWVQRSQDKQRQEEAVSGLTFIGRMVQ
jgi:hypothetical protein